MPGICRHTSVTLAPPPHTARARCAPLTTAAPAEACCHVWFDQDPPLFSPGCSPLAWSPCQQPRGVCLHGVWRSLGSQAGECTGAAGRRCHRSGWAYRPTAGLSFRATAAAGAPEAGQGVVEGRKQPGRAGGRGRRRGGAFEPAQGPRPGKTRRAGTGLGPRAARRGDRGEEKSASSWHRSRAGAKIGRDERGARRLVGAY
jgi:hypothetical protein